MSKQSEWVFKAMRDAEQPKLTGIPKAGLHALQKACGLLGVHTSIQHAEYAVKEPGLWIYITREPRNMVVSHVIWEGLDPTPKNLIACINDYHGFGHISKVFKEYEGWLTDQDTLVISYEELTESPAGIEKIAGFMDVPVSGPEFDQLPGGTETWQAKENWRDHWTPKVESEFSK